MEIRIPGKANIEIEHLLLDFNGTIARDGKMIGSVKERVEAVCNSGIKVYVVTADTHGTARDQCADMPIEVMIFDNSNAAANKRKIAEELGAQRCICFGNGFNDTELFEACALSVIVMGDEGCSSKALIKSDIVCKNIDDAFNLILKPNRIIATLRG